MVPGRQRNRYAEPADLPNETLFTYPVPPERLDVFTQFLVPANCRPRHHRNVETTEMMLQLVAAGRGVSAIPDWLVRREAAALGDRPCASVQAGSIKASISDYERATTRSISSPGFSRRRARHLPNAAVSVLALV